MDIDTFYERALEMVPTDRCTLSVTITRACWLLDSKHEFWLTVLNKDTQSRVPTPCIHSKSAEEALAKLKDFYANVAAEGSVV